MSGRVLVGAFGARRDDDLLLEADRAARREAQRRFDRPLVLEAGAGTGKTTTLIGRLLAWTLGVGWEAKETEMAKRAAEARRPAPGPDRPDRPDRIAAAVLGGVVAITFTEAAAAEMASRAARELGALALGAEPPDWLDLTVLPPPEERARRARALASTLDHLAIRTIHAFCLGLLADHPLEAGLHPDLQVDADGLLLEAVVQETVESSLREGYGDPGDPHLLALAARGFGPREVAEALIALVQKGLPSEVLREDPLAPERVEELRGRLIFAARSVLDLVEPLLTGVRLPNAKQIEERLGTLADRLLEGPMALEALRETVRELLPENLVEHLDKKWGRGSLGASTELRVLGESREELMPLASRLCRLIDHVNALDPGLLEHARLGLAPLLAEVERTLRSRGIATFDSLLTGAERLLARHLSVRTRVRRGIDQLLVDEFQDTDRVQCEILRWIALDGPPEERPGLFLVGDPKQSIYGWRSADLRAYDGFLERVRQGWGEVRPLVENFRSVPAILDEVARAIEPVMRERPGLQPRFERLLPCDLRRDEPGFAEEVWAPVEHWVSWGEGRSQTLAVEATELEAAAVASDLVALHGRGEAWKDMAILLRGMSQLDLYLEALRRAGVPFAVGRDKHYYRRREVIDAAALVRSVLDPGDHLALLTVLRSPSVGVPDAALIPLWARRFPKLMTELASPEGLQDLPGLIDEAAAEVPPGIPGMPAIQSGWAASLKAAVAALAELRQSFAADPADLFLEKLRGLLLVDVTEAARYLGPYRLANLDRFFRQLLKAMEDGGGDAFGVLRSLRRSVAEAREAEEGRPQDGAEDAVQVMTIHGAKGLDFKHVYLVQLHRQSGGEGGPRTEAGRIEADPEADRWEYRLLGAPTLAFDLVDAGNREVEAAERVRTLYVAMTRAKDRLVLAGVWPEEGDPRPPEQARSHLELLLWRPGRPGLAELWEQGAWSSPDRAGALWKFPVLRPEAGDGEAGRPETVALPSAAEVARESGALAARRAEAEARMGRRFGGAASEDSHDLLREQQADRRTGDEERSEGADRDAAMAAGGAVHRALETWDLTADPAVEAGRQRGLLPSYLGTLAEADVAARALPLATELLEGFAGSRLLTRLRDLKEHVVARELPVLLPPSGAGAIGVVTGTIDLLYRDPATGRLVVADYKTDAAGAGGIEARAAVYASQGGTYVRALREALALEEEPRFELWFLRAERVVEVNQYGAT
ncbi:MAG: UvrD-helicase domain-containing protein [Acidobacteriota bacterium]